MFAARSVGTPLAVRPLIAAKQNLAAFRVPCFFRKLPVPFPWWSGFEVALAPFARSWVDGMIFSFLSPLTSLWPVDLQVLVLGFDDSCSPWKVQVGIGVFFLSWRTYRATDGASPIFEGSPIQRARRLTCLHQDGLRCPAPGRSVLPPFRIESVAKYASGLRLTVPGGYQSEKPGLVPFNLPLGG